MNTFRSLYTDLKPAMRPVSVLYAALMRLRARCYQWGLPSRAYAASRPVISVGNISWGGSGKTPLAAWLLDWATRKGLSPALLTRGYKARPPALPYRVQPGDSPAVAGDEPLLLARSFPQAQIIIDPKRARAAAWVEKNDSADIFILDDGMQHLAMGRHCDFVVLHPRDLLEEWNAVIPAGSWREPASALARASAFFIKADARLFSAIAPAARQRLAPYGKPLFSFYLEPQGLSLLGGADGPQGQQTAPPPAAGCKYLLVSAVGEPAQVAATASIACGAAPHSHTVYADHWVFSDDNARELAAAGMPVVCTAKDAVKLLPLLAHFGSTPVWVLDVKACFNGGFLFTDKAFPDWWESQWQLLRTHYKEPFEQSAYGI